jgi:two-component system sensor histidine kinase KdpD
LLVVVTIIGWSVRSFISPTNLIMLYLLTVVVSAFFWGLRPAIMTAVVGVLMFDFFFIPPYFSFHISDTEYIITVLGLTLVGAVISFLVARTREHAEAAQVREKETGTLYALSQDLAVAMDNDAVIRAVTKDIGEIFQWDVTFLLPEGDTLVEHPGSPELRLDPNEVAVALWAYKHGVDAGYDTDTLHDSRLRYIPLQSSQGVLGIMGVMPDVPDGIITSEQARILTAFANQAAVALERVRLASQAMARDA